ncbi:MAG: thiamine biosynthesis protein ThiF [Proteobacteria bacterium]|nr:MAG: thiamine biosynthesis protein ThiF [Pseudomonadota bacterium]
MNEYYKRQVQLWGEDVQQNLKDKSIAIIGCGGLGCSLAYALSSSGIGQIHLVDFDTISAHNIHRQIAFSLQDLGKYKCEVLASRLKERVLDDVNIMSYVSNFEEFTKKQIPFDLLLDASDNLHVRSQMDKYAKGKNIPWIYTSVEEFNGQVCFFDRASFNGIFKIQDIAPKGQCAPMVMQMASFEANLALRYLLGLGINKDKLYYLCFDKGLDLSIKGFQISI